MTALAVSTEKADRRFVLFYVPMTILAATFALRQFQTSVDVGGCSGGPLRAAWPGRVALWGLATLARAALTGGERPCRSARGCSTPTPHGSSPVSAASIGRLCTRGGGSFLLRKPRAAVAGLLGLFFAVSLTLDGLWLSLQR